MIFVTATSVNQLASAPKLEQSARLKGTARHKSRSFQDAADAALCRMHYQRLAVESVPHDGEAWHYLSMTLRDFYLATGEKDNIHGKVVQKACIECLQLATKITPGDGRLFNNLALSLGQLFMEKLQQSNEDGLLYRQVRESYERSALLHKASEIIGIDIGQEYDTCILNHGLFVANLDQFRTAVTILSCATDQQRLSSKNGVSNAREAHLRLLKDVNSLKRFCEQHAQ